MKIKEIPKNERPIERLINNGVDKLSNEELIAIILKTGTSGKNVKDLSLEILKNYDIHSLKNINLKNLLKIKGIGKTKAATLISCIELSKRMNINEDTLYDKKLTSSKLVFDYYKDRLKDKKQECFYCIYLDSNKRVLKDKLLFLGTLNYSMVHPREVFKEAYMLSANSIICVHNHPSGDVTPSKSDIELTKNLISSGMLLGIKIDDHIIVGKDKYYSFYEEGII